MDEKIGSRQDLTGKTAGMVPANSPAGDGEVRDGRRRGGELPGNVGEADGVAGTRPLDQVESELCTLAGQLAAGNCRFLELIGEFDRRQGWAGAGVKSCAHWLSWRCGLDLRTAREHVRVARSLQDLPLVRATFSQGRLSYSKVRAIARVATPTSEKDLVHAGLHAPAATLDHLIKGFRTAGENASKAAEQGVRARGVRPDGSTPGLPRPRPDADRSDRPYLQWRWDEHGRLIVWGRLDAVEGASLLAAAARLEPTARQEPTARREHRDQPTDSSTADSSTADSSTADSSTDGPAGPSVDAIHQTENQPSLDCRPPGNLAAAVTAMAQTILAGADLPRFAPAAEVTVLVGIDELHAALAETNPAADHHLSTGQGAVGQESSGQGSAGILDADPASDPASDPAPARLQDGPALSRAALRRLADDAGLRTAVLAGDGRTLDLGRRTRRLTKPQLATLWRRDQGCRAPGCSNTRYLHAHHVRFWSRGGRTDLDNLVLLCGEHHRQLHLGRFRITTLGEQRFAFLRPDGTAWLTAPPIQGDGQALTAAHPDVTDRTITPDWDGRRLDLSHAVGTYLDSWAAAERRPA